MSRPLFCAALLAAAALLAGSAGAADPASDKALRDALADVHNKGADLYNQAKDYAGAYRLYEGALRAVRPSLTDRPATQRAILDGLAAAEREATPDRKAFILHETIEKVRGDLKTPVTTVTPEPKKTVTPEPKKTVEPEPKKTVTPEPKKTTTPEPKKTVTPEPKKTTEPEPKKTTSDPKKSAAPEVVKGPAGGPTVKGVVTYKGAPVANAELLFVSLDRASPIAVAAKTNADGTYSTNIIAGRYVVTVAAPRGGKADLPARYATTDTSGLTAVVSGGATTFDIALQ
jgi:hypothetical protein